jgi:protein TonB
MRDFQIYFSLDFMRRRALSIVAVVAFAATAPEALARAPFVAKTPEEAKPFALKHPYPEYPLEARRLRLMGKGIVVGIVDRKSGNVTSVTMEKSTGHAILDDAVLRAFRQWRFKPGTIREFHFPVNYVMLDRPPR